MGRGWESEEMGWERLRRRGVRKEGEEIREELPAPTS